MRNWDTLLVKLRATSDRDEVLSMLLREVLEEATRRKPPLRRTLEFCAVVHRFDEGMLAGVGEMLPAPFAGDREAFEAILQFPFVRPHPAGGYALHEDARRIIRKGIFDDDPPLFKELNTVAVQWFRQRLGDDLSARAEEAYHQLAETGGNDLSGFRRLFGLLAQDHAVAQCRRLLRYAREHDNLFGEPYRLRFSYFEAQLADLSNDWRQAEVLLRELMARGGQAEEDRLWASSLLGDVVFKQGRWDEAIELFEQTIERIRQGRISPAGLEASLTERIGLARYRKGDWGGAEEALERALQAYGAYPSAAGRCLDSLAKVVYRRGDSVKALQRTGEALQAYAEAGDVFGEAWVWITRARIWRRLQDLEEAKASASRALELLGEMEDPYGRARALHILAECLHLEGEALRATELLKESIAIKRRLGDRDGLEQSLDILGLIYTEEGLHGEALTALDEARQLAEALEDRYFQGKIFLHLGRLLEKQGLRRQAIAHLERSLEVRRELEDLFGQAETLEALGEAQWSGGRAEEARRSLREAVQALESLGEEKRFQKLQRRLRELEENEGQG